MTKAAQLHLPARLSGWRRSGAMAAILAAMLAFGGCRTTSLEDVAPTSLTPPAEPVAETETMASDPQTSSAAPGQEGGGARDTGRYPNLNIMPSGETAQISEEERAAKIAELEAAKKEAQSAGGKNGDEAEKLRRIARKHAEETLKEIKAE